MPTNGAHKETFEGFDLAAGHRTDRNRDSLELRRPAMRLGRGMMRAWTLALWESRGKVSLKGAEVLGAWIKTGKQ